MRLAEVRKAAVAVVGVVAQIVALGLCPDEYLGWANVLLAVATAAGVYQIPNAPKQHDGAHELGRIQDGGV